MDVDVRTGRITDFSTEYHGVCSQPGCGYDTDDYGGMYDRDWDDRYDYDPDDRFDFDD